jgi:hypothetical protein
MGAEFRGEQSLSHFLIGYADLMCAAQTVVVLAESMGLGSVYVGTIQANLDYARQYFHTPEHVLPLMVLCLGYPQTRLKRMPKLKREVMVHRERYRAQSDEQVVQAFEDKYGPVDDNVEKYLERAYVEVLEARKQGEDWLEEIRRRMGKLEITNSAQFLFRVRYPSEVMIDLNAELLQALDKAGFDFGCRPQDA